MMNGSLTTVLQEDIPSFDIDRNKIFKCKYYDKGCRYKGTANDMINVHPHECNFEIIPCPNQGCDVKIERGQLGEHLKKCDYRDVHCIFCKQFYIFKEEKVKILLKKYILQSSVTWKFAVKYLKNVRL